MSNIAIGVAGGCAGFFGCIGSSGTVQDLGVEIASFARAEYVGCIAGGNESGTITACCWSDEDVDEAAGINIGTVDSVSARVTGIGGSTWEKAMETMNSQLSSDSVGWEYEENTGEDQETVPPTLKKSNS